MSSVHDHIVSSSPALFALRTYKAGSAELNITLYHSCCTLQAVSEQQTAALLAELPLKWEKLGDLALLPHHCMMSPSWPSLIPNVWEVVCHALRVRRLARQAPVANTGKPCQSVA